MTTPRASLPPLRASRKQGIGRFSWNDSGVAAEGWTGWRAALSRGTGWWSALSPDGTKVGAVVLSVEGDARKDALLKVLRGEGHVAAGAERHAQWTGALEHVVAKAADRSIVVLPLLHPVDVGSPRLQAQWAGAVGAVTSWLSRERGITVDVPPLDSRWPLPWTELASSEGAPASVDGMVLSREGEEALMISAEPVDADSAEKSGGAPRVRLQVGPTCWNLTARETRELLVQLRAALDVIEPSNAQPSPDDTER